MHGRSWRPPDGVGAAGDAEGRGALVTCAESGRRKERLPEPLWFQLAGTCQWVPHWCMPSRQGSGELCGRAS